MEKNKTGKPALPAGRYLKYAIGEIILVVIGILIALQINTWNTARIDANSERIILKDLRAELITNISELEHIIDEHNKSLNAAIKLKNLANDKEALNLAPKDSLGALLMDMNANWTYNPKLGILKSIINSGKLDLVRNKELRYMLSSVQDFIIDTNESTEDIENMREIFYWPDIASKANFFDGKKSTNNYDKELNPQFIWWIKWIGSLRMEALNEEKELLLFFKQINSLIEAELNQ
jgi:hypothetical protein